MTRPKARYSEKLWAYVDRTGHYRTLIYYARDEAIKSQERPNVTEAKWALVRVSIQELPPRKKARRGEH